MFRVLHSKSDYLQQFEIDPTDTEIHSFQNTTPSKRLQNISTITISTTTTTSSRTTTAATTSSSSSSTAATTTMTTTTTTKMTTTTTTTTTTTHNNKSKTSPHMYTVAFRRPAFSWPPNPL